MVERVHARRADRAIRVERVPPLPDGRRAQVDGVQPRWVILVEQQSVRQVVGPDIRKHPAEVRCADKTRPQMGLTCVEPRDEIVLHPLAVRIWGQIHKQRQHISRLGRNGQPSGRGEVFLLNSCLDLCG